ncbi:MAG: hypothetical protein RDV48_12880 [Candidatus Eremiobacteraeota bacterium]|nr:hypothetical protein [Candidatus Eremiobacteraeota bacterium]
MIKKIIACILVLCALICVGDTLFQFIRTKGAQGVWSSDVLGASAFHGVCMIIASFLLAGPGAEKAGGE